MADVTIYLVRHAIAEESGPAWANDEVRPLSRDGTRKWRRGAAGFAAMVPALDLILTSPLLRASQTAEILQGKLPTRPPIEPFELLAPDHAPAVVMRALRQRGVPAQVALVGHEPSLSRLGSFLLQIEGALALRKGSALAVTIAGLGTRGPGRLEWFASPRMLRRLGAAGGRP